MFNVTIDISGPGGCVGFEAELVIRALQQVGYKVEVTSNWNKSYTKEEMDKHIAHRIQLIQRDLAEGKPEEIVKINVDHLPWGG